MSPDAQKLFDKSVADAQSITREHPDYRAMTPEDAARLAVQVQVILLFPEISKEDQTFLTALAFVRLSTYCVLNFTDKKRSSREQEEDRQDSEILFMDAVTVVRQSSWLTDLSNDHREILESEFLTVPFVEKP